MSTSSYKFITALLNDPKLTASDRDRIIQLIGKELERKNKDFVTEDQLKDYVTMDKLEEIIASHSNNPADAKVDSTISVNKMDLGSTIHSPREVVNFLKMFSSNSSALKYTTHTWDKTSDGGFAYSSYDDFMKLPCLLNLYICSYYEITDSIDDGTYYGEIVAVSEDGDYMLVTAGDPVSVTKEEYDALEVGDVVYSGEFSGDVYVQEIDDKGNKILSDYSMWFAPNGFTGNEDEYILVTSSVNPMTVNDKLFVVPISPDCEIDDHTEYLFSEPAWNEMDGSYDEYLDNLEDSTSLQETLYWFHFMVNNESGSLGNGWRETGGLIYPIVVENGEVTMMSIQWR